jgi:hypothetical protein
MPPKKYDGVIECARYTPEGRLSEVRIYERRGPTYSDRLLINRAELLQRLRLGKKYAVGARTDLMASTFQVTSEVRLLGPRGQEMIVSGTATADNCDDLQGAPLF